MEKQSIQRFPADLSGIPIPHRDFDCCLIHGLFEDAAGSEEDARPFFTYIPEGLRYDAPCLVIALPSGTDPADFLAASGLQEFADRRQVFLDLLVPRGDAWDLGGADADYMNAVYRRVLSRDYYVAMQDNIYAFGLGDGATVAQQAAMKRPLEWSGLGTIGPLDAQYILLNADCDLAPEENDVTKTGEMVIQGGKGQLPVWMAFPEKTRGAQAAIQYWREQNHASDEVLRSDDATEIYLPGTVWNLSPINEENISQVRITEGPRAAEFHIDLLEAMWNHLKKACRHRGIGKKFLRYYKDAQDYGAVKHELEHAGYTRLWYEFVPESVQKAGRPVPLVVCMHGRGGNAETFLDISGMTVVAQERGFIVAFPKASMYQQKPPAGIKNVLFWSEKACQPKMDNVGFIRKMVEDISRRNPVDPARIYSCGQSSGGAMAAELALYASDLFAAAAPWSLVAVPDGIRQVTPQDIPVCIMRGSKDGEKRNTLEGRFPFPCDAKYRESLEYFFQRYSLQDTPYTYTSGVYTFYEYRNQKGVPMLTFVNVEQMPHADVPEESWLCYDLFLSKFSREKDGSLYYMGHPAR